MNTQMNKILLYQDPHSDDIQLLSPQAEGEDPLSVGLPAGRAAELPQPVLQQRLRQDTPCAGAFHPALPFQVSTCDLWACLLMDSSLLTD